MESVDSGVSGLEPDAADKVFYLPEEDINMLQLWGRLGAGQEWLFSAGLVF